MTTTAPTSRLSSSSPPAYPDHALARTAPCLTTALLYSTIPPIPTPAFPAGSHTPSLPTDLSLPSLLSQQHLSASVSPKGKGSALLTAARQGKGHLDKAMHYLLDSDTMPDKCPEPIWLLGVMHPGYEPLPPPAPDLELGLELIILIPLRTCRSPTRAGTPRACCPTIALRWTRVSSAWVWTSTRFSATS